MRLFTSLLLLTCVFVSSLAWAHSDEYLDTVAAPHGGQLRMAGAFHFELVVTATALQLHVTDHAGKAVSTLGASGNAVTLGKAGKQTVALSPRSENVLEGTGTFDPAQPLKAVVTVSIPGHDPLTARFDTAKLHQGHHTESAK